MSAGSRLQRSRQDRIVAGVAGGIAKDMGASPGAIRLAFVVLLWLYLIGGILYVALWIAMPLEPEPEEGATSRTLKKVDGGVKLVRSLVGIVAGIVGILEVALPLSRRIATLSSDPPLATVQTASALSLPADLEQVRAMNLDRRAPAPSPVRTVAPTPVVEPPPRRIEPPVAVDYAVRDGEELRTLAARASQVEADVMESLDESALYGIYAGEALEAELRAVRELRANDVRRRQELVSRQFLEVASDGQAASVQLIERWRVRLWSPVTGECQRLPEHAVPQTMHLVRTSEGWRVHRIDFGHTEPLAPEPCEAD